LRLVLSLQFRIFGIAENHIFAFASKTGRGRNIGGQPAMRDALLNEGFEISVQMSVARRLEFLGERGEFDGGRTCLLLSFKIVFLCLKIH
jgi:hypothetical protein